MTPSFPERGRFITFEGGEGVGKSTQIALLSAYLQRRGLEVVVTREPGGTPKAETLRRALLSGLVKSFGPLAETALFAAARIDHIEKLIAPALRRGAWVLCDRFMDSTRAYQGENGGVNPQLMHWIEAASIGEAIPDLTLILDLDPHEGLLRAHRRRQTNEAPDRFEAEALSFHLALRRAFHDIAREHPQRCRVVDATAPVADVARIIQNYIDDRFFNDDKNFINREA
ncbi:MAG: dTMP kinase [Methylocystaceae bacterium]|nr:dTMP kinase [Methylocystaceae bacterium]NBT96636.1 dTMP kinase [Methylocystaceae bacterium]